LPIDTVVVGALLSRYM